MKITIHFRHPWSDLDHVAHIQREDLNGKQARRVLTAIDEERTRLGLYLPCALDLESIWASLVDYKIPFPAWPDTEADDEENKRNWRVLIKTSQALQAEQDNLDRLRRYYEPRTYTEKELDDLTREEWAQIEPIQIDILRDEERELYGV